MDRTHRFSTGKSIGSDPFESQNWFYIISSNKRVWFRFQIENKNRIKLFIIFEYDIIYKKLLIINKYIYEKKLNTDFFYKIKNYKI